MTELAERDAFDARRARAATGLLLAFNEPGVLAAADVHVAQRLAALAGVQDEAVVLAAAFAVRAPRLGHVFVDLARIRETATVDTDEPVDVAALPWPEPSAWVAAVAASRLAGEDRPLRLEGSHLYLDRYWREERQVASDLETLARGAVAGVDADLLREGIARSTDDSFQRLAAAAAVLRRLAVVAGGPGTGKTTTVARIVALLEEQAIAAGGAAPLIALAAPTGKAAARLQEAVRESGRELQASTLHRLLGWRPGSHSRFRHDRGNRLPHDVVIVDETSMVSLSLMARLLEAVRPDARLILVGDPGQLTSIEAGAVLGDIVGPAAAGLRMSHAAQAALTAAAGVPAEGTAPPEGSVVGDGIVVLRRVHRFQEGGGIAAVADAIRAADAGALMAELERGHDDVTWIAADPGELESLDAVAAVRERAVATGRAVIEAARAGDAAAAIAALGAFRVLCAHRRGPHGVATWMPRVESWLAAAVEGFAAGGGAWYVGRPLLVTENDHGIRLYNGDTGVVVATPNGRPAAAFDRGAGGVDLFSPARLSAVETVYAMTVHKAQGSQFDTAAVLLPPPDSPILTRELLYTAVTRAKSHLILVGTEASVRAAAERPIARASGLRARLWRES